MSEQTNSAYLSDLARLRASGIDTSCEACLDMAFQATTIRQHTCSEKAREWLPTHLRQLSAGETPAPQEPTEDETPLGLELVDVGALRARVARLETALEDALNTIAGWHKGSIGSIGNVHVGSFGVEHLNRLRAALKGDAQ